ncbi:MAG: HAMP domain-containing sensor histidine kinase [Caldilineaceae bacterium]
MFDNHVAQLVLQQRSIAYLITDATFTVQTVGGKAALLQNHQHTIGVGDSLYEAAPELVGYEEELAALLTGSLPLLQLELVNRETAEGALYYVTLHNYPHSLYDDEISGILHIIEDVTLVGQTNQRLTQQRNELILLRDELARSNLQLEVANTELRALDELKSKFVAIAAHELRTPLASIIGYVDFLLVDLPEAIHPDLQSSIETIGKGAKRLLAITNNLLDVTRIEAGRLELTLQSVALPKLIDLVLHEQRYQIAEKEHTVRIDAPATLPLALCDETRTTQILSNLLSNAIKYTPAQGEIQLRLHYAVAEEAVIVEVADNGIGIPEQDLQNIGKNFFRASNVYLARTSGAGLGLNITRSLVELQGGRFWIESAVNRGTTVFVTLPVDDGLLANQ